MPAAEESVSSVCPGCGAVLASAPESTADDDGGSACARLFAVTVSGLRDGAGADPGAAASLRLADAAYAAQHPDPTDQARLQSALDRLGAHSGRHAAPPGVWQTTIADVAADLDVIDLAVLVEQWARTVAEDWSGPEVGNGEPQHGITGGQ
jgi:hypothetical protein